MSSWSGQHPCNFSIHTPHAGSDGNSRSVQSGACPFSIHTPHAGSDTETLDFRRERVLFQSTLPMRGATFFQAYIHPVLCFQSTLPMRGATIMTILVFGTTYFQSTLPMRGATIQGLHIPQEYLDFSIHTPHAGSDCHRYHQTSCQSFFNPHSPCGERRKPEVDLYPAQIFQSTLPMRGATNTFTAANTIAGFFNPHSPCGERHAGRQISGWQLYFQSTLPMRGATTGCYIHSGNGKCFQSTLPMRGATLSPLALSTKSAFFNPHSPCGERRPAFCSGIIHQLFNPHSPCGERRCQRGEKLSELSFSIHTPHAGSDGTSI